MRLHAFSHPFPGLNVNIHVFGVFSMCEIFLSLLLPLLMEFG